MPIRIAIRPRYVGATVVYLLLSTAILFSVPLLAQLQVPDAILPGVILVSLVFVTVFGRTLIIAHQWIELDGDIIRFCSLLTGRVKESKVSDIVSVKGPKELGLPGSVRKGYEIEFNGTKLLLSEHEMGSIDEFLIALADRVRSEKAGVNPSNG